MAKQCAICKKTGRMVGKRVKFRGQYNPTIRKRKYPNLQWLKVPSDTTKKKYKEHAGKRILACTKCIKALSKRK
jgi:ribosomal protein L28